MPVPANTDVLTTEPAEYETVVAPVKLIFRTQWLRVSAT